MNNTSLKHWNNIMLHQAFLRNANANIIVAAADQIFLWNITGWRVAISNRIGKRLNKEQEDERSDITMTIVVLELVNK